MALLSVLPVAALPAALRHQVLGLIADGSPGAVAQRLAVGQRAGALGPGGFPRPLDPPSPVRLYHGAHSALVRGGAAAGGAAIVGGVIVGGGLLHHPGPAGPPGAGRALPTTGAPSAPGRSPAPSSGGGGTGEGVTSPGPQVLRTASAGGSGGASDGASTAPAGSPSAPATSAAPSPGISAVVTGTLTVSPASLGLRLSLSGLWTGTLTLTAHGGPVSAYHLAVPVPLLQELTVSQASGSLAAGQSVQIRVTAAGAALFSTALLTVSPGGLSVPVTYQLLG